MRGQVRYVKQVLRQLCLAVLLTMPGLAAEYHGLVCFNGLPVPGATVTVTQGGKKFVTVTDLQGLYSFPSLADGTATVVVEMTGFHRSKRSWRSFQARRLRSGNCS
jgi:hypothetical protein